MRRTLAVIVMCLIPPAGSTAWAEVTPEFRMFAGAYVPTGKMADVLPMY